MKVTLKDDVIKEFEAPLSVRDIAESISEGLARNACAGKIDGQVVDLRTMVDKDANVQILTFQDEEGRAAFRHTASHILAQAVKRLYPETKLAIGPSIENGFYYDFDREQAFTREQLDQLEAEMKKIVKENLKIERFELSREEALQLMREKGEEYKVELIEDLPEDAPLSFYRQGEFVDLCAGPHLMSTKEIKAFKLTSVAGAYWRGNENNKMLCRVYGTAFTKKADLEAHLTAIEEAKKRDHNKLGRDLKLFTTVDYIGQGLPIILPKGAKIMQTLIRFVEDEEERRGYQLTKTPYMAKSDLYKISGHWDHYKEGMFILGDEETDKEVYALRPMTCPFQFQAYLNEMRSYRDLPMRLGETSTLFRNEASGEMHGLIRVRQFTISEGHLMCTPEQLQDEFAGCLDLANYMLKTVGLSEDVSYRFSKWDPNNRDKYIGSAEQWEAVQAKMKEILDSLQLEYTEEEGEAAFYGPKLDIQIRNVHGKEDTLITIQIDFQLAERFGMEYIDRDGSKKYPYIIHRTSLGCYERTLALLIEKYAGAFPLWLAPVQAKILPISEKFIDAADAVYSKLRNAGIRVELDDRAEKIGYKIREAQMEKVPYMLIIGQKEVETDTISVRGRARGELGSLTADELLQMLKDEIDRKVIQ